MCMGVNLLQPFLSVALSRLIVSLASCLSRRRPSSPPGAAHPCACSTRNQERSELASHCDPPEGELLTKSTSTQARTHARIYIYIYIYVYTHRQSSTHTHTHTHTRKLFMPCNLFIFFVVSLFSFFTLFARLFPSLSFPFLVLSRSLTHFLFPCPSLRRSGCMRVSRLLARLGQGSRRCRDIDFCDFLSGLLNPDPGARNGLEVLLFKGWGGSSVCLPRALI
jgi:hypothetical protein